MLKFCFAVAVTVLSATSVYDSMYNALHPDDYALFFFVRLLCDTHVKKTVCETNTTHDGRLIDEAHMSKNINFTSASSGPTPGSSLLLQFRSNSRIGE